MPGVVLKHGDEGQGRRRGVDKRCEGNVVEIRGSGITVLLVSHVNGR